MAKVSFLEIIGHQDYAITNTLIKQDGESKGLALLLPGAGYRSTMPLLHYPERLLHWLDFDVLRIDHSPYSDVPGFNKLSVGEKEAWLFSDASHIGEAVLAERDYRQIVLLGKSIGTLAIGHLITNYPELGKAVCVWLTPLLKSPLLVEQVQASTNPSLFVIGTADSHYDTSLLESIINLPNREAVVIDDANHSLNIERDMHSSLAALQTTMSAVESFLSKNLS